MPRWILLRQPAGQPELDPGLCIRDHTSQGSAIHAGNGTGRRPLQVVDVSWQYPAGADTISNLLLIWIRIWAWTRRLLYGVLLSGLPWLLALILALHLQLPFAVNHHWLGDNSRGRAWIRWGRTSRLPAEPRTVAPGRHRCRLIAGPPLACHRCDTRRETVRRCTARSGKSVFLRPCSCIGMPAPVNGSVAERTQVTALTTPNVHRRYINRQRKLR